MMRLREVFAGAAKVMRNALLRRRVTAGDVWRVYDEERKAGGDASDEAAT